MIYLKITSTSEPRHHDIPKEDLPYGLLVVIVLRYIMVSRFTSRVLEVCHDVTVY
jgi:hypothetical protein